jgi:hypothetical protein
MGLGVVPKLPLTALAPKVVELPNELPPKSAIFSHNYSLQKKYLLI